jgi:hypothetical protein
MKTKTKPSPNPISLAELNTRFVNLCKGKGFPHTTEFITASMALLHNSKSFTISDLLYLLKPYDLDVKNIQELFGVWVGLLKDSGRVREIPSLIYDSPVFERLY